MPKQFPPGFRRDVVEVARSSGLTQAQVARDFGISENTVQRWVKQANIDDGLAVGATSVEQAELVALRRRARVLEQEVEILRRATAYFAKDAAPK
jgi:transposase-like protein